MESILKEIITALQTLFANPIMMTAIACLVIGYLIRPVKFLSNDFIPPILFVAGGILFSLIGDNSLFPPEAKHLGVWKFLAGSIVAFITWTFHKAVLSKLEDKIPFLKGFVNWADTRGSSGSVPAVLLALSLSIFLVGCGAGRLTPGGAYAPTIDGVAVVEGDHAFFVVDSTFALAYSAIDGVFAFEKQNRLALWKISPEIKRSLDKIRPAALKARNDYIAARKIYLSNPVPANLSQLESALLKIQQLSTAATAVVPKNK